MVVNQATLRSIGVGFSTLFNRAFENTETTWEKVATKVTSDTKEQEYVLKISGVKKLKLICSSDDSEMKKAHPEYQKDLPVKKGAVSIHLPAYSARFYQVVE